MTPTDVVFTDGTREQVDCVVLCTGFAKATAPFLNSPVDIKRLFKSRFDPQYREMLASIGFVRPPLGSIPPMSELQARWLAQLLTDKTRLPSSAEMNAQTDRQHARRERYYRQVFRRLPHLVDYSSYMDELAELIGCKPG